MSEPRKMYFKKRRGDGSLYDVVMTYDHPSMEILSMEDMPAPLATRAPTTAMPVVQGRPTSRQAYMESLRENGYGVDIDKDGTLIISSAPELEGEVYRFFTECECWFDGCEELRAEYKRRLEELPDDCPSCVEGDVMRAMLDAVRKAIQRHRKEAVPDAKTHQNTGS
jgi:hypothetical protein